MNALEVSDTDIDRIIKSKWRKNYQEEISENKDKLEREKIKKYLDDKEYLERLKKEEDDDKMKRQFRKFQQNTNRLQDYQIFLEKKKKEDLVKLQEKEKEKELVTLNFKSDERLKNFKEYIDRLNDNIESNMNKHKQFMQNVKKSEYNSDAYENIPSPYSGSSEKVLLSSSPLSGSPLKSDSLIYNPNFVNSHRSDITNADYFSKNQNQEYFQYRNAQKDFLKYNKEVIDDREKRKLLEQENRRNNNEQMLRELEKRLEYEEALKKFNHERQSNYKSLLDNQIDHSEKRVRSLNRVIDYNNNNNYVINSPNSPLIINSATQDFSLGKSLIEHNPILNPIPNYRHNKYLLNSRKMEDGRWDSIGNSNSCLRFVGNRVIN